MTDEKDELETFFEGEDHPISTEPEQATEQTPKPDQPAKVEQAEGEPESEPEVESETTSEEKPTLVPIAALHDERRKAQQAREEAERLRQQIPVKDEAPDPYEDIDAYNEYMRQKWEKEQLMHQDQIRRQNLDASRSRMLEQHEDYDEMERIFELMTVQDRSLIDKMFQSGDEAKFAYETAKAYKQSLLTPQVHAETPQTPIEVPNLAKATAQAGNTPQVEQEATIEDIFADQEY
jgi:hypothetical protein